MNLWDKLLSEVSNTREADDLKCSGCFRKIRRICKTTTKNSRKVIDRSNRIDCEHPTQGLVTYHIKCWWKEINGTE